MAALDVHARLVGGDHARLLHGVLGARRGFMPAEAVGALVHAHQVAHAVPRAAAIVDAHIPDRAAREDIQTDARHALQKLGVRQIQHAAQNGGEMLLLFVRHRAEREGAGNIRRALQILAAGVDEQQVARLELRVALRRGAVMHHRGVGAIGADRVEARGDEVLLFLAERQQLVADADFRHRDFADVLLEPVHQPRNRHAVLHVRPAQVIQLHVVLDGLHHRGRVLRADDFSFFQRVHQRGGQLARVRQHLHIRLKPLQRRNDLVIAAHIHALVRKRFAHGVVHLGFIDEPVHVLLPDDQIAHHHRRVEHVAAAHIEHPRDVIQHVEHMELRAALGHRLANRAHLALHALTGVLLIEDERLFLRHRRAILPKVAEPVARIAQQRAAFRGRLAHILREFLADHAEIHAQRVVFMQQRGEVFLQLRRARRAHAHQRDAAPGNLPLCLNEVAAVHKQRRLFFPDDQRAR